VKIHALCHNRLLPRHARLEVVQGSISDRGVARKALDGVTHVLHCATCKENLGRHYRRFRERAFWLLEECRTSPSFEQFILLGGDCAVAIFSIRIPSVTEQQKHSAYPGCYALSKVLEEVMLEQYFIQYG